jgi:plastocyanin
MKKLFAISLLASSFLTLHAQAKMPEYTIEIKNHRFIPSNIDINSDERVKLIVKNLDKTAEEFESNDLKREKIIQGNRKATFLIGPLKKGTYKFFGEFHEDTAKGTVTVK